MPARGRPTKEPHRLPAAAATALLGVLGALCVLWEAMEQKPLFVGNAVALILVALAMGWWTIRVELYRRLGEAEDVLKRIVLSRSAPGRAPTFDELTPYQLGADEEGSAGKGAPSEYLPRDRDRELPTALADARQAQVPQMIVVSGPSKSGKSRTLYEAVASDRVLAGRPCSRRATCTRSPRSSATPSRRPRPAPFSCGSTTSSSSSPRAARASTATPSTTWRSGPQPVVVVATAGGKGADLPISDGIERGANGKFDPFLGTRTVVPSQTSAPSRSGTFALTALLLAVVLLALLILLL